MDNNFDKVDEYRYHAIGIKMDDNDQLKLYKAKDEKDLKDIFEK